MAEPFDIHKFYSVLGVSPQATPEQIKRAFRTKAKDYHPDRNKAPSAAPLFLKINEAYQTLSDPKQRAAYDALPVPAPARGREVAHTEGPIPDLVACVRCGQVSAQPRYVVLRRVVSYILITRRTNISGVFCRTCADYYALRASAITWLTGWWSFPRGPAETIAALWINLWGGNRPRNTNAELLERQTRAFAARGNYPLAAAALQQAMALADSDAVMARLSRLHGAMAERLPSLKLVDRWQPLESRAFYIQLLPILAVLAMLSYGVVFRVIPNLPMLPMAQFHPQNALPNRAISAPAPTIPNVGGYDRAPIATATAPIPVPSPMTNIQRNVWNIALDGVSLRHGPGQSYAVMKRLARFTPVFRFAVPPGGDWALVQVPDGEIGYVQIDSINPGSTNSEQLAWCALGPVAVPANGAILWQGPTGQHSLSLDNESQHDMVVKLKDATGKTALAFYVKAASTANINTVPAGDFKLSYATGAPLQPKLQNVSGQHAGGDFCQRRRISPYRRQQSILWRGEAKPVPFKPRR